MQLGFQVVSSADAKLVVKVELSCVVFRHGPAWATEKELRAVSILAFTVFKKSTVRKIRQFEVTGGSLPVAACMRLTKTFQW